jgi:hypothetical protein
MNTPDAWKALIDGRAPVDELEAPPEPGVYAIFLAEGATLPLVEAPETRLLYVGSSTNLAQRDVETHFADGQSGFSTIRRSLGALLKDVLDLTAIPRGTGASDTNYRNYRFEGAGESRLMEWMKENLEIAVLPAAEYDDLETRLIAEVQPALCLKGWANPHAATIKASRKQCVEEARRIPR